MNVGLRFAAIGAVALFGLCQPASAVTLYDNGAIDGTYAGANIYTDAVSNSFTLSAASTLTGVNFGVWYEPGSPIVSVDWAITTTPTFPTGTTASVTLGPEFTPTGSYGGGGVFRVAQGSFSLPSIGLAAGTYYLMLRTAVTNPADGQVYWDDNQGSSIAYTTRTTGPFDSESFQILGTENTKNPVVPLPAALPLFATGLTGLGLTGWRRKRKAAGNTAKLTG